MLLCDANAVLRFVLDDIPEQAALTERAISEGAEVTVEVLAECVYVLVKVYGLSRETVSECLLEVLPNFHCRNADVVSEALHLFCETRLDFVDCELISESKLHQRVILSFDKKLNAKINDDLRYG